MKTSEAIYYALSAGQRILLCVHMQPDGDTLGSALALAEALRDGMGKHVRVTCTHPVPGLYAFLPGAEEIVLPGELQGEAFDVAVAVDVSDHGRLGDAAPLFDGAAQRLVIDHHGTNHGFGQCAWVDASAAATGMLVQALIAAMGIACTRTMAICLYTALSTDTGHFSFGNTDAACMQAASELVACGVDVSALTKRLYRTRSREAVTLLGMALRSLALSDDGRMATMILTADDFAAAQGDESLTEGIVNYAIEIQGVCMAALLRENEQGVKCSLRSVAPWDVARVAQAFGGGGHTLAAGCTLQGPIGAARAALQRTMAQALDTTR